MKNLNFLFIGILFISLISCSKENIVLEEKPIDESIYFDNDIDCSTSNSTYSSCCDVDGRILVEADNIYSYSYGNKFSGQNLQINWTVINGSITIVSGQNTNEANFRFNSDFTTGIIKAFGEDELGNSCSSSIAISKL